MIKPDVLLSQPRHIDYPLFRYRLPQWSKYFNQVLIALTQDTMPPDITQFLVGCPEYKNVKWVRPPKSDGKNDWRNLAVRDMIINFSKSPYILFLEQDFLVKDESFWERVFKSVEYYDLIYYQDGDRVHPAFALTEKELVMKTRLDFAAHPPYDHFGEFFKDLMLQVDSNFKAELKELAFKEGVDYKHLAGLTNNYHVFKLKQPFYKPEEFLTYNHYAQRLPIQQEPSFRELEEKIEDEFKPFTINEMIESFFPKEPID